MRLWRCVKCEKWSHASRQPKHHQRFIRRVHEDETKAPTSLPVISDETPFYDHTPEGGLNLGGWWVKCGPFEAWTATRGETQ